MKKNRTTNIKHGVVAWVQVKGSNEYVLCTRFNDGTRQIWVNRCTAVSLPDGFKTTYIEAYVIHDADVDHYLPFEAVSHTTTNHQVKANRRLLPA